MSTVKNAQIRLKFGWRSPHAKECYAAICEAVRMGYDTKDALLHVLPQFSLNRLVMALDSLLAAEVAQVNMNTLTINPDMLILETLAAGQAMDLPLAPELLVRNDPLLAEILAAIGVQNPGGALTLLKPKIEEIKDDI
ncbi:hypothetical protein [Pseudomonas viridiflava]|uniref:hypothetical protein n=1 Tax=Pseudomonas viridiflava TaxID=33069 RepID=UPI000F037C40|nr:hypothetical protein [Pseudomonas viridiflava]